MIEVRHSFRILNKTLKLHKMLADLGIDGDEFRGTE